MEITTVPDMNDLDSMKFKAKTIMIEVLNYNSFIDLFLNSSKR